MRTARPYQMYAARDVVRAWAAGRMRPCAVLATGAGKTFVASLAIGLAGTLRRVLAISHTTTLQDQLRTALAGPGRDVRSETVQGLLASGEPIDPTTVDVVVIDEAHHYARGGRWAGVFDLLPPGVPCILLTATPERADGAPLGGPDGIATDLIAPISYSELLANGWLAPIRAVDTSGMCPAAAYLMHARSAGLRVVAADGAVVAPSAWRPGVLFSPTRAACAKHVATLRAAGVRAEVIDSGTPRSVRRARFAAFDRGELDLLASPMALSEGFDSPRAKVVVLDRMCEHVGLYLQTCGRVLRVDPAAPDSVALLLDCVGAVARHGLPTDDRIYSLDGVAIARKVPRAARSDAAPSSGIWARSARDAGRSIAPVAKAVLGGMVRSIWNWMWAA